VAQTVGVPHETLGELVVTCIVPHAAEHSTRRGAQFREEEACQLQGSAPGAVLFEGDLTLTGTAKIKTAELRDLVSRTLAQATAEGAGAGETDLLSRYPHEMKNRT